MSISVGQYLVQRIKSLGIDTIFTVPGEYIAPFLYQIKQQGESSSFQFSIVTVSNDQEAAYAADAYAKVHKTPAVIASNFGPGTLQTLNAITGSTMENVPIIIISGARPLSRYYNPIKTKINETQLWTETDVFYHSGCASSERIENPSLANQQIDQLFTSCLTCSSPVYLEIPSDVFPQKVQQGPQGNIERRPYFSDQNNLKQAVKISLDILNEAQNPLVIAGSELCSYASIPAFQELLKKCQIPYATLLESKGILTESTESGFVGVLMGRNTPKQTHDWIQRADVLVILGVSSPDIDALAIGHDMHTNDIKKKVICASKHSIYCQNAIFGNVFIRDFLTELTKNYDNGKTKKKQQPQQIQSYVPPSTTSPEGQVTYDNVMATLASSNAKLMEKFIAIADTSFSCIPLATLRTTQGGYVSQITWSSSGYSLSAALGVSMGATDDRLPMVFIGDGGFQANTCALSTLAKYKSKGVIFVFRNGVNGLEQWVTNPKVYREPKTPVDPLFQIPMWDFGKIASAVDISGKLIQTHVVKTVDQLQALVKKMENVENLMLVEVQLQPKDLPELVKWRVKQGAEDASATDQPILLEM